MEEHAQEALDRIDRRLLEALQADARLTTAELAQQVALSPSPCWRRVKRLEALGLVRGYHAELDPERLGWGVTAFVQVTLERHEPALGDRFEQAVRAMPEIVACHNVSGAYDYLLQVLARDLKAFGEFSRTAIRALPGVKEMNSRFSLREVKRPAGVPVVGSWWGQVPRSAWRNAGPDPTHETKRPTRRPQPPGRARKAECGVDRS